MMFENGGWLHMTPSPSGVASVPVVNWWSWHGERERDALTWCSLVVVELGMRKREMRIKMGMIGDGMRGYGNSGVRPARLVLEYHLAFLLTTGSGVLPPKLGMGNCQPHGIIFSPFFSWLFPNSPLPSLSLIHNSTITRVWKLKKSLSITPCHNHENRLSTEPTEAWMSPSPSQFYLSAYRLVL